MSGSAPNLVNVEGVRVTHATRTVLDGVALGIAAGERIGILGRNGAGKTTLLDVLAGRRTPDGGRVTHRGGLRTGYLAQGDDLDARATVRHCVVADRADHEWRSDPASREVVAALLRGIELEATVGTLSGGERRRVALAALLLDDPDLLLLDEPTNHLDVETVDWLSTWLASRSGAVVAVTHDRWFLDAVCQRTWEVSDGVVYACEGGYAAYVLARAERLQAAAVAEDRRRALVRKELAWLRRGPPARTTKPKFRLDAAAALVADEPAPRDRVELTELATARLGRSVYDLEDVGLALGGRPLLQDVTWRPGPGDRIGIVGVNGAGKTTLLRLLAGDLSPDSGRVERGRTVRAAMLSQEVGELPVDARAIEAVEDVRREVPQAAGGRPPLTARQLAERFGFTGERLWTRVGEMSGGERRRLQFLRLLMTEPNVLLLDEPTNDLDVETLAAVEDLLDGWPGTLFVVSHDRYFLERVCDRVVGLLGDGSVRDLPGGVEEYLRLRAAARQAAGEPTAARTGTPAGGTARGSGARGRDARKEMVRIERRLTRAQQELATLYDELIRHARDPARLVDLDRERELVQAQIDELESLWLAAAESAEE